MVSHLDAEEILGYQVDEVAAALRMASLGFRPHGHFIYFYLFIYLFNSIFMRSLISPI